MKRKVFRKHKKIENADQRNRGAGRYGDGAPVLVGDHDLHGLLQREPGPFRLDLLAAASGTRGAPFQLFFQRHPGGDSPVTPQDRPAPSESKMSFAAFDLQSGAEDNTCSLVKLQSILKFQNCRLFLRCDALL